MSPERPQGNPLGNKDKVLLLAATSYGFFLNILRVAREISQHRMEAALSAVVSLGLFMAANHFKDQYLEEKGRK